MPGFPQQRFMWKRSLYYVDHGPLLEVVAVRRANGRVVYRRVPAVVLPPHLRSRVVGVTRLVKTVHRPAFVVSALLQVDVVVLLHVIDDTALGLVLGIAAVVNTALVRRSRAAVAADPGPEVEDRPNVAASALVRAIDQCEMESTRGILPDVELHPRTLRGILVELAYPKLTRKPQTCTKIRRVLRTKRKSTLLFGSLRLNLN